MMILVTAVLFAQGWKYFDGDVFATLATVGGEYASAFNRDSHM